MDLEGKDVALQIEQELMKYNIIKTKET